MVIGKSQQTMCIGADLAWWGGTKSKASQADHVWSGWVTESGTISGLKHSQVSLAGSETTAPPPWPEGPHRDPFGIRFLATLNNLIQATGAPDRILIGIDAPLEAEVLDSEVPRQKCYRKGEVSETRNRKCERELRCHIRAVATEWAKDVRIQAGAPLIPRVSSIVDELKTCGFALGAGGRTLTGRDLVEVFPSASIGALGAGGAYGTYNAVSVRLYKTLRQFSGREEALKLAAASLLGFQACLGASVLGATSQIAHGAVSALSWNASGAKRTKVFDDVIDAGLAFLTTACVVVSAFQWIGDGSDGAILLPRVPEKETP